MIWFTQPLSAPTGDGAVYVPCRCSAFAAYRAKLKDPEWVCLPGEQLGKCDDRLVRPEQTASDKACSKSTNRVIFGQDILIQNGLELRKARDPIECVKPARKVGTPDSSNDGPGVQGLLSG